MIAFLLMLPLFLIAVTLHEVSHGWVALCLGDRTAKEAGRLTLNPLKHIDPVGTVVLPMLLLALHSPNVFGWAKPVPVNALRLRHPKRDMLWVGVAGPAANFLFALVGAGLLKLFGPVAPRLFSLAMTYLVIINLVLGTFNLLPIPPLDGSRILTGVLPWRFARSLLSLERWGILLVMLLFLFGFVDRIIWPVVQFFTKVLGI